MSLKPAFALVSELIRLYFIPSIAIFIFITIAFDSYFLSTGIELANGWYQNESVSIQQGHLLSSITKNQRILLSSDFIRAVNLTDYSSLPPQSLINLGDKSVKPFLPDSIGIPESQRSGLFQYMISIRIPGHPNLVISFKVAPYSALLMYISVTISLLILVIFFIVYTTRTERREARKREDLLKTALEDFVNNDEPSALVLYSVPKLISKWREMKAKLSTAQKKEVDLASRAYLVDLARQVAHDIRSPLSALSVSIQDCQGMNDDRRTVIQMSVERINEIANDLLKKSRQIRSQSQVYETSEYPTSSQHEGDLECAVAEVVDSIIGEKKVVHGNLPDVSIQLIQRSSSPLSVRFSKPELGRVLSNLIDNAVESLNGSGEVKVHVRKWMDYAVIAIEDNGIGMTEDTLNRLGIRGFSIGKKHSDSGSGLGVYHAKHLLNKFGGSLNFQSRPGVGTIATVQLPLQGHPVPSILSRGSTPENDLVSPRERGASFLKQ